MQGHFQDFLEESSFGIIESGRRSYYLRRRSSPDPDIKYRSDSFGLDVYKVNTLFSAVHPFRKERRWVAAYRDNLTENRGMILLSDDEFDSLDNHMVDAVSELDESYKKILSSI